MEHEMNWIEDNSMNWIAPPDGQRCRLIMKSGSGNQCYGEWDQKKLAFWVNKKFIGSYGVTGYSLQAVPEREVEEWAKA